MIYLMSDLHGCYDKFIKMLKLINFADNDELYILGDIVDRGENGLKIIDYVIDHKNIHCLCGNHDYTARIILSTYVNNKELTKEEGFCNAVKMWLSDGGNATFKEFIKLNEENKERTINFLSQLLFYKRLEIDGKKYFLSHTLPERAKIKKLSDITFNDLIIGEPDYEKQYSKEITFITGHTPTSFIDEKYTGKIYKNNGHIAIDCGAVFYETLGCLCLDNLKEYYVK